MKEVEINGSKFEIVQGDITKQESDAVVNAANKRLAPGGGVAGAIHNSAGPKLYEECKRLGGCETGEAKITNGYDLHADHVIHTVGPVYSGTEKDEKDLRRSYRNSLQLAVENDLESVSFPALSTGAFGYPTEEAAKIAFEEIRDFLKKNDKLGLVRMVLYSEGDLQKHENIFEEMF